MSGIYTHGKGPDERETTMRDLVAVLFRRKWLILSIFLVVTVSVGLKSLREPVTYSADTTLLLNRAEMRTSQLERRGRSLPWVEVVESEIEVLRSLPVMVGASELLAQPTEAFPEGLQINHRQLQNRVKAGVLGESNVVAVSATAPQPKEAVAIANAVAESYLAHHQKLFEVPDASLQIRARADSTFQVITSLEETRAGLLSEFGHTEVHQEEQELVTMRLRLWSSLGLKEIDIRALETEIEDGKASLLADLAAETPPFTQHLGQLHGSDVQRTLDQLRIARRDLTRARAKYTEQHPEVAKFRDQVAELTADVRAGLERILAVKEHELRVAKGDAEELRGQVAEIDRRLNALPHLRTQLQLLESQISDAGAHHEQLLDHATAAEINEMTAEDYGVALLSPAVSARRNQTGDMVRLALGPLLALMAGIGLAFYLENLDHSLQNREDIERHLEIPVLASFPEVSMNEDGIEQRGKQLPYQKGRARSR